MSVQPLPMETASRNPWLAQPAMIDEIRPELPNVATYRLRLSDPVRAAAYRYQPGQFNMLYVPGCGEVAISLSGSPESDGARMLHTIRVAGRVTEAISRLRTGDMLGVRGPFGAAWPLAECKNRDVIIIAGGIGLAPLRPLIYHLIHQRAEFARVVLLIGARSPDLMLFAEELEQWRAGGVDVRCTVDRANPSWSGSVGVVSLLLDQLGHFRPEHSILMTCGPEVMMHYSAISGLRRGMAKQSIWLSMERNMQCAVGLCGHCQLGPHFICKQGPVLRYDAIEPYLKVRDF